jgi:hypothetical protein
MPSRCFRWGMMMLANPDVLSESAAAPKADFLMNDLLDVMTAYFQKK